jgi:hypothetical protein
MVQNASSAAMQRTGVKGSQYTVGPRTFWVSLYDEVPKLGREHFRMAARTARTQRVRRKTRVEC